VVAAVQRPGGSGIRLALPGLIVLAFAIAGGAGPAGSLGHSGVRPGHSHPAFTASRHPDTTDTRGPYRVTLRQLAGPRVTGGQAVYSVVSREGTTATEGTAPLKALDTAHEWIAEIPGQARGTRITYHFRLSAQAGARLRHPARAPTGYQFHVNALHLIAVTGPTPGDIGPEGARVSLLLRAARRPSGEVVARLALSSSEAVSERRLPLSTAEQAEDEGSRTYLLTAALPRLELGQVIDFYFHVKGADGSELRAPEGAPRLVYSVKRPVRRLQHIPGEEDFVLSVSAAGRRRWVGLKGGGAWAWDGDGPPRRWGAGDGLRSGVARFVLPDPASGRVYIGTDREVAGLEAGGTTLVALTTPQPSLWAAKEGVVYTPARRAGPAAMSTLDGELFFQTQDEAASLERPFPRSRLFQFRHGSLSEWKPPHSESPLVGLSSVLFDDVDGCWLLGGLIERGDLWPAVWRRCGESVEPIYFDPVTGGSRALRIVALARDPSSGGLVIALERRPLGQQQPNYGVYRLDERPGRLSPLAPELEAVGVEVTSLVTDWRDGRILIGTSANGLLEVKGGLVRRLAANDARLSTITTIAIVDGPDAVLAGTPRGAFQLSERDSTVLRIGPRDGPLAPADALPMDVHPSTGHVLLSSHSSGLVQLARSQEGDWQPLAWLSPGRELPQGSFGEAQYTSAGGVVVILHSRGLLTIQEGQATLLGTDGGLHSPHLLRLLSRRSGDIWIAHTPTPFGPTAGGALQFIRDSRVVRTRRIADRRLATISRWVEVPERDAVFAATQAGVIELSAEGSPTRRSVYAASSIARNPATGTIGVVGATVERWTDDRFRPVLFRLDHPRWPTGSFQAGSPIDLAIDAADTWYVLFPGGVLALLGPGGDLIGLLDSEDGIPGSARRLLAPGGTGNVFVGSLTEGLVVVSP